MKNLILALALLLYFTSTVFTGQPDVNLHKKCLYPTIMVRATDRSHYGTGCIIRSEKFANKYRNIFLTCAHIIGKDYEYEIVSFEYEKWSQLSNYRLMDATIYAINHERDLAIGTFVSDSKMPTAVINIDPEVFIGNDVFRIGCGMASEPRLDHGKITSIRNWYRTSIFTIPGDSGSPVFHEYKIVGIMKSIRIVRNFNAPAFKMSFAVPSWQFKEWSKENDNSLDFTWNNNKPIPRSPFIREEMKQYKIKR